MDKLKPINVTKIAFHMKTVDKLSNLTKVFHKF